MRAASFTANGSWHDAATAQAHLRRKIELAASHSSPTGEPYRVRCPYKAGVPSRQWLLEVLARQRSVSP
ncbi:DUF5329 family protein [Nevskia sp.]|uniref:DUF5329 family protein n=1 Tax=Nevskia sp. TaxID=1929292 RepID=UPI00345A308A